MRKKYFLLFIFLSFFSIFSQHVQAYDDSGAISITGTVAPKASEFDIQIDTSTSGTVHQDEVLTYTVSYTSNADSPGPLTLQAQWFKGTIDGAPTATVDMLSYEVSSASNAYGAVTPTIDLNARTITWSIPSMPIHKGEQHVTFQLKTTDAYTGSKRVVFPVIARITTPSGVPESRVERVYEYNVPATSSPTPTPTSIPTAAENTVASEEEPSITSISIVGISDTSAKVEFTTSRAVLTNLLYGKSASTLGNAVLESEASLSHTLSMTNLQLGSRYYFRVYWLDEETKKSLSDVFVFDTSSQAEAAIDQPALLTASQSWGIAYSLSPISRSEKAAMVAVSNSVLDLQFVIANSKNIRTASVIVRPPKVLGISTEESAAYQSKSTVATEIGQSMYVGKVKLPQESGVYDVILRTEDIYGNLNEKKLAEVKVVKPWQILDQTQTPLQNVKVLLYRYNSKSKVFELLPNTAASIKNPVFSDSDGIVDASLFPGKYKAQMSLDGYADQEIEFDVAPEGNSELPTVILEGTTLGVQSTLKRLQQGSLLGIDSFWETLVDIIQNKQLVRTRIAALTIILPILTWIAIGNGLKVPLLRVPVYLLTRSISQFKREKRVEYIKGSVLESGSGYPIQNAYIRLISDDSGKTLRGTWTGQRGEFHFVDLPRHSGFTLEISAHAYAKKHESVSATNQIGKFSLAPSSEPLVQELLLGTHFLLSKGIEFFLQIFLFVSAITGLVFAYTQGIFPALPFLTLTSGNILLWIYSKYIVYR